MFFFTVFTITWALATFKTSAHMLLEQPMRFPSQLSQISWNGPLVTTASGGVSDYPCKLGDAPGTYDFDFTRAQIPLGSNYTMKFLGQSVHGGGSCQVSISKALEPTRDSVFKVIHSIVGGCPARNTPGNIGDDSSYSASDPFEYEFTVPDDLEAGSYTFAWTWFNKIGNREMYMNCAPIEFIAGATTKQKRDSTAFDALPNMFLANIPDVPDCNSPPSGANMMFPQPGNSVERNNANDIFDLPMIGDNAICYAPLDEDAFTSAGNALVSSVFYQSISSTSSTIATSQPYASATGTATYEAFSVMTSVYSATTATLVAYSSASTSTISPSSGTCGDGSVSCAIPGALVCVNKAQFGICDTNYCAVAQNVAIGTVCSNGAVVKKRSLPQRWIG